MTRAAALAVAAGLSALSPAAAAPLTLPPPEAPSDPGARAFADALRAAVDARDGRALGALAAPDVKVGFGGGEGRADLADAAAEAWDELGLILSWPPAVATDDGGRWLEFPFFAQTFPDDLDVFEHLVALPGARLRPAPSGDGGEPADRPVDWAVVHDEGDGPDGWLHVCLIPSPCGYLREDDARSPIGLRLIAQPDAHGWRITALVEGD